MTDFELSVSTRELMHALNVANGIIEKKNIHPILGNIKLDAFDNRLKLTSTSMDLALTMSIGAQVISDGVTTVNVQTFSDIIRKLRDTHVTLKFNSSDHSLSIIGSKFSSQLETLSAEGFPAMDEIAGGEQFTIAAHSMLRLLETTGYAMSAEETRYNLNGIFLSSQNGKILTTAIDGHRLATAYEPIDNAPTLGLIIPKKSVFELVKILRDAKYHEHDLIVECDTNRIAFRCNDLFLISKLIDATFPDYSGFIPKLSANKLTIHRDILGSSVDRVATITVDKYRAVKLEINATSIFVSATGEARGSAREEISVDENDDAKFIYEGEEMTIGLNPRYLLDALAAMRSGEIEIYFANPASPILIKFVDYSDDAAVIMPIKV